MPSAGTYEREDDAGTLFIAGHVVHTLGLAWRAGPVTLCLYAATVLSLGLVPAGTAMVTKWLLDVLQSPGSPGPYPPLTGSPVALVIVLGVFALLLAFGSHLSTYLNSRTQRGVRLVVQERLYSAVNRLDGIRRFEEPRFLDRLRLAQQAATTAPDDVVRTLFGGFQSVLTLMSLLGILLVISPVVAGVTVIAALPVLFIQVSIARQQNRMQWGMSPRFRRQLFYQSLILDLAAIKETRLFGTGGFFLGRMRTETTALNGAEELLDRRVLLFQGPLALLGALVASGGLIWMVGATARGEFTIGDLTAFIAAVAGVQSSLGSLIMEAVVGYRSLLLFGHYGRVVDVESDLPSPRHPVPVRPLAEGITCEDVWFRYTDDGPWVLRGVSFTIPVGRSLAIVGLNGAGKSTLIRLLCRMYDPSRGRITWDGTDIREFDVAELRARISAVFQDYMTYDLSVRENIAIGALEQVDHTERLREAARLADADVFASRLSRGYDTMLSRIFMQEEGESEEEGVTLSGGQWQRIAIARALVREQRDLLFLDEPSAGLDAAAEQAVHDRLRAFQQGATTVLISHRMGVVRHADRILVIAEGTIVEDGDHDQLMELGGQYRRLFSTQAANYADAPIPLVEG